MRNATGFFARRLSASVLFLSLGGVALAVPSGASAGPFTVGDFLLLYARSTRVVLPADATPELAYEVLKAAGSLPSDPLALGAPLTQGVVVSIGKAAGLKLSSKTPQQEFGRDDAGIFLQTYASVLTPRRDAGSRDTYGASFNPPGDPAGHANTDKGKKKGRPFQSDPEPH